MMVGDQGGRRALRHLVGAFFINPANWTPVRPLRLDAASASSASTSSGRPTPAGSPVGMLAGAAIIFFAYIGFDSVSTHAEEAKNPQRDVPIGIIASLLICTVLYIAVVAVLTGMVPYDQIDTDAGVSERLRAGRPRLGRGHHRRSPAWPASPRCCWS